VGKGRAAPVNHPAREHSSRRVQLRAIRLTVEGEAVRLSISNDRGRLAAVHPPDQLDRAMLVG